MSVCTDHIFDVAAAGGVEVGAGVEVGVDVVIGVGVGVDVGVEVAVDVGVGVGVEVCCIVSVSVALLLLRFGSKTPFGAVTVAVSEILPYAEALTVPVAL